MISQHLRFESVSQNANDQIDIPNSSKRSSGLRRTATAIYPSSGPPTDLSGLPATVFRLSSNDGRIARENPRAADDGSYDPQPTSKTPSLSQI